MDATNPGTNKLPTHWQTQWYRCYPNRCTLSSKWCSWWCRAKKSTGQAWITQVTEKLVFGVYQSRVGTFISNVLSSMEGKIITNSSCNKSVISLNCLLMIQIPSRTIKTFSENLAYTRKGIYMWSQVCERQQPHTLNDLLANLHMLFILYQVSTQETPSYLGKIRNLILQFKLG